MLTNDLDFTLPPGHLATTPTHPRDHAKLMVAHRHSGQIEHLQVCDLATREDLIRPGDLLVFNQSKVLPAFLKGTRTATGGRVRGLFLEASDDQHWEIMLESGGKLQENETIILGNDTPIKLIERLHAGRWRVQTQSVLSMVALLEKVGSTPLPPYIQKARRQLGQDPICQEDAARYNTVYASNPGSVAAPTAGLHFTNPLLKALADRGVERAFVTLHIGVGTFEPVRTERVADHNIHAEPITVNQEALAQLRQTKERGGRIIPVGTTTVRTLESLPENWMDIADDFQLNTRLFIHPQTGKEAFTFRFTDSLMTNFHLPQSTLLAMVASLPGVGLDQLKAWYALAIEQQYRFYSYGDAMFVL